MRSLGPRYVALWVGQTISQFGSYIAVITVPLLVLYIQEANSTGLSTAEFDVIVTDWFKTARHPRFKRPYTELAFQPMLELLAYLRANGFKTYIVSGGGIEFMRPMTESVYGVPPEQVIGSSIKTQYEI